MNNSDANTPKSQWMDEIYPAQQRAKELAGEKPSSSPLLNEAHAVEIRYTNHRGEFSRRTIVPVRSEFKATEHHPRAQWILHAFDMRKQAYRDFAFADILPTPLP